MSAGVSGSVRCRREWVMSIMVAVTGGIGAGKSTVSGLLAARGALVVDSDRLAREVVGPGTAGLSAVVAEFGPGVQTDEGALDRPAMAAIVFADAGARRRLEAITHPIIRVRFAELAAAAPPGSVVVNDIPLLTTPGAAAAFHLTVGVGAPETVRIERLIARGMSEADAQARIAAQIGDAERRRLCDVWLDNSAGLADMRQRIDAVWARLAEFAGNVEAGRPATRGGPALAPYNPAWQAQAERLAARLRLLGGEHRVDHIGSTAVPGMPAKDVIDLQLTVDDLDQAYRLAPLLTAGGFPLYRGITADTVHPDPDGASADNGRWRKRLHVNADPGQRVNLHLRVRDWPNWTYALRFRDWLRADPDAAREYAEVKRTLADRYAGDPTVAGYAGAKEEFLRRAGVDSAAWAAATGWSALSPECS